MSDQLTNLAMADEQNPVRDSSSKHVSHDDSLVEPPPPPAKMQAFPFLVFAAVGSVQLLGWNSMLNAMNPIFGTVFGVRDSTVTVTAAYSTTLVLITIAFMFVNVVSIYTVYAGLALSAILSVALGLISQYSSTGAASPLFHVLGVFLAICSALIGSSAFGYAAQFPVDYSGAMSCGLGLAGVITFVLWMLGNHAMFDGNTAGGTRSTIWLLCIVMTVISVAAIALTYTLFRKPWVQALFNKKIDVEEQVTQEEGTYEKEGLTGVLKRTGWMGFMFFLCFFCTLALFPTFGPLGWIEAKRSYFEYRGQQPTTNLDLERDVLMGVFQVCDLIARYLPTVLPILNVSSRVASVIIFSRFIFFATFIMSAKFVDTIFTRFWFMVIEQILMTLTSGWMATVCFARMFESVEGGEAKARVASFALLCTFFGIAGGQWFGFGLSQAIM